MDISWWLACAELIPHPLWECSQEKHGMLNMEAAEDESFTINKTQNPIERQKHASSRESPKSYVKFNSGAGVLLMTSF